MKYFLAILLLFFIFSNAQLVNGQINCAKLLYTEKDLCSISDAILHRDNINKLEKICFLTHSKVPDPKDYPKVHYYPLPYTKLRFICEDKSLSRNIDTSGFVLCENGINNGSGSSDIISLNNLNSKLGFVYSKRYQNNTFKEFYHEFTNYSSSLIDSNSTTNSRWHSPAISVSPNSSLKLVYYLVNFSSIYRHKEVGGKWETCPIKNNDNSFCMGTFSAREGNHFALTNRNAELQMVRSSSSNVYYSVLPNASSGKMIISDVIDAGYPLAMKYLNDSLTVLYVNAKNQIILATQLSPNTNRWKKTNLNIVSQTETPHIYADFFYSGGKLTVAYYNRSGEFFVKSQNTNNSWDILYYDRLITKQSKTSLLFKSGDLNCVYMRGDSVMLINLSKIFPSVSINQIKSSYCEGDNFYSTISIKGGNPPFTIKWQKNGLTLSTDTILKIDKLKLAQGGQYNVLVKDKDGCEHSYDFNILVNDLPTINELIVTPRCNSSRDGSIKLLISGGKPTYSFIWNNMTTADSLTMINAGQYSVTVTDMSNCAVSKAFTLNEPPVIKLTAKVDSATTGNNGRIELTVNGGTPPFTYNWNNGSTTRILSNLNVGEYKVTITDKNGCKKDTVFKIYSSSLWPIVCNGTNFHFVDIDSFLLMGNSFGFTKTPLQSGDWVGIFFQDQFGRFICTDAQKVEKGKVRLKACSESSLNADDGFAAMDNFYYKVYLSSRREIIEAKDIKTTYYPLNSIRTGYPSGEDLFEGLNKISVVKSIGSNNVISKPNCSTPDTLYCGDKISRQYNNQGDNNSIIYCDLPNKVDGPEVIYTFFLDSVSDIKIIMDSLDADLELFLLPECNNLNCISYSAKTQKAAEAILVRDLKPGRYYIVVDGYNGSIGRYDLRIECGEFPEDDFTIPGGGTGVPIINEKSCNQKFSDNTFNGEQKKSTYLNCTRGNEYYPGKEKIYTLKYDKDGIVKVTLSPKDCELDLFVFSELKNGACFASSTQSGVDSKTKLRYKEFIEFGVKANKYYYLIVDEYASNIGGNFDLEINCYEYSSGGGSSGSCYSRCDTFPRIQCGIPILGNTKLGRSCRENYGFPCNVNQGDLGKELVYIFENSETQDIDVTLDSLRSDLNIHLLDTCISRCLPRTPLHKEDTSAEKGTFLALPKGIYSVVIDTYEPNTENSFYLRFDCAKTAINCFKVKIDSGPSYISSPIVPNSNKFSELFPESKFKDKILISNDKAKVYIPGFIDELKTWNPQDGYFVNSDINTDVEFCGKKVDSTGQKAIDNYIGKDSSITQFFIGYPFLDNKFVTDAFGDSAKLKSSQVIKFETNLTNSFSYNFIDAIGNDFIMEPGKAYVLKYRDNGSFSYRSKRNDNSSFYNFSKSNALVFAWVKIPKQVQELMFKFGDEIGVFSSNGVLVGNARVEEKNLMIPIYGDDPDTKSIEGLKHGEKFYLKVYNKFSDKEYHADVAYNKAALFKQFDVYEILSIRHNVENINSNDFVLYPNPSSSSVELIAFNNFSDNIDFEIYNCNGVKQKNEEYIKLGERHYKFNVANLNNGLYFLKIGEGSKINVIKFAVQK